jgi:hypothetical protein
MKPDAFTNPVRVIENSVSHLVGKSFVGPSVRRLSQYTAPILLCFLRNWAQFQHVHSELPDDGIFKMSKHVGVY